VREYRTPGTVRGPSGNRRSYLDWRSTGDGKSSPLPSFADGAQQELISRKPCKRAKEF